VFESRGQPVEDGGDFGALTREFEERKCEPVPAARERRFAVLPETIAPLVSLMKNPQRLRGKHLVIDMGAGTTELSINHVPDREGDAILCFFDQSVRLGTSQFEAGDETAPLLDQLLRHVRQT